MSTDAGTPSLNGSGPAEPQAGEDRLVAFGRWLTRERELRALSRDEISKATRVAPGMVEALETGERERMPARAYAVGYLRAYAAAVGLDPDEVVLRWQEAASEVASSGRVPRGNRLRLGFFVLALAAILAAGFVLLRLGP